MARRTVDPIPKQTLAFDEASDAMGGKPTLPTPAVFHGLEGNPDIQTRHGRVLIGMVSFFTDPFTFSLRVGAESSIEPLRGEG
jgi:hypothetical protein